MPPPWLCAWRLAALALTAACAGSVRGQVPDAGLPTAAPEAVGFSAERLKRLDALMQRAVDERQYAGVVTLLARHGKVIHFETVGQSDLASEAALKKDAIFRVFSMTKPITGAAMMLLYEDGKWSPQDPIWKFIPEFAHLKVYRGSDEFGRMTVEDCIHPPTMRELMSHTAGFGYGSGSGPVDRMYRTDQDRSVLESGSLHAMIERLAKVPLLYQPSSRWMYSVSCDIQGYIVEKLSGMSLPEFMKKRLFEPLGMHDTDFYVPEGKRGRLASLYRLNEQDQLVPADAIFGVRYDREPSTPLGGAGLVSTAADYFRFAQMLLNGGELNGVRIMSPQTVKLMTANHLADRLMADYVGPTTNFPRLGMGYGYDGASVTDPGKADVPMGKGTYLWDGAAGTWFWVDPTYDIVFVGMVQNRSWHDASLLPPNLQELSRAATYQAFVRPDL